ncbi:chloride channel protein [Mariprofundus ferrooxydans]|nr:chloride channel protein [Mariprofundus ferrooxydans]KON47832.1 chloride channel protein EriC [Mariprofundus ferrooxydans]
MSTPVARSALIRLTMLGTCAGALAGLGVLLFRWCIELSQTLFLPGAQVGNYEGLSGWEQFLLPVAGGLLLGAVFSRIPKHYLQIGVVHILDRIHLPGKERLPLGNTLVQFFGGLVAIVSGQSVDREGPGVHIGAASANLIGSVIPTSAEENHTLIACGAAASIAAAFNTPLAGVVFVIEVLQVKYRIIRFFPVIMAAVVGAIISRGIYGQHPAFTIPSMNMGSLLELPFIAVMGFVIGLFAMLFVSMSEIILRTTRRWPLTRCYVLAGLCTGILAQWTPQIMGISYDTLELMLHGQAVVTLVLALIFTKLIATATCIGLRIPGGLIGPMLVIGGAIGSVSGFVADGLYPAYAGSIGFYAILGMVAMLGAALRAPLSALIALLELTANPNIILPGMLAVVSANVANLLLLGKDSAFSTMLQVFKDTPDKP